MAIQGTQVPTYTNTLFSYFSDFIFLYFLYFEKQKNKNKKKNYKKL